MKKVIPIVLTMVMVSANYSYMAEGVVKQSILDTELQPWQFGVGLVIAFIVIAIIAVIAGKRQAKKAQKMLVENKGDIARVVPFGEKTKNGEIVYVFRCDYNNGKMYVMDVPRDHPDYNWLQERSEEYEKSENEQKQARIEQKQERIAAKTPIRTRILDGGTSATTTKAGGVGRAIAGGIVAGPIGAVVGAATAGHKTTSTNYTIFKVWYQDGHSEVEKVEHGTAKYKKYLELIED